MAELNMIKLKELELEKVAGGSGIFGPIVPGIPYIMAPDYPEDPKKDEDKGGGVTYTW